MSNEIEYIEPTQEHVGQIVEVEDAGRWVRRKLLAVLPSPQAYRFICESIVDTDEFGKWQFARIPRPLTYAERQARCGIKVGDRVRFMRAWDSGELGTHLRFYEEMTPSINKVGVVTDIKKSIRVEFGSDYWWFPYFVLEKVEDRVATRRDIDAVVYVDGNPQDVFTLEHWYSCDDQLCRAVVRSGDKRFVYELSNLRVKE